MSEQNPNEQKAVRDAIVAATKSYGLKEYIGTKRIRAVVMIRGEWCAMRGWTVPANEDPKDLGYLVEYMDGGKPNVEGFDDYVSWSPANVFEESYTCVNEGMSFGHALVMLVSGKKVARAGWNGKGMWLCAPLRNGTKQIPATGIWGKPNAEYAEQNGGTVTVMPYITMKAADGSIVMGWLASQTDMLATDWVLVD